MGDFPLQGDGQRWTTGSVSPLISSGASVTAGSPAHTKGSWAALITAANNVAQADGVLLGFATGTSYADFGWDLAAGAAGSEVVIASNLLFSGNSDPLVSQVFLPISLPTGVRLAIRTQSTTAAALFVVSAMLVTLGGRPSASLARLTSFGATIDGSNTKGTSVDPGAVTNTKGSWVELTSSTANPIQHLAPVFSGEVNTARVTCAWLVDIGVGAAGSEQVYMANLMLRNSALLGPTPVFCGSVPAHIAAGTRIAARAQCSISDATDRLFGMALIGVD